MYILDGTYKTLHLIADTRDVFRMWDDVLRRMQAELIGGWKIREAIWERRCWGGGSGVGVVPEAGQLSFAEVEKMCKKLNINSSPEELERLFNVRVFFASASRYLPHRQQADLQKRNFLDFDDFRRFVKLLKGRPEIDRLFRKARDRGAGAYSATTANTNEKVFDFPVFERFMREKQKVRSVKFSSSRSSLMRILLTVQSQFTGALDGL